MYVGNAIPGVWRLRWFLYFSKWCEDGFGVQKGIKRVQVWWSFPGGTMEAWWREARKILKIKRL